MKITTVLNTDNAGVITVITEDDGFVTEKEVYTSDFEEVIRNTTRELAYEKEYYFRPPAWLDSCGIKNLYLGKKEGNSMKAVFFIPGGMKPLNYHGETFYIPYPSLVMDFEVIQGFVNKTYVYAVKEQSIYNINEETELYRSPFGNVSSEGSCCWGEIKNSLSNILDYGDFSRVLDMYFGSEVNDDYYRLDVHVKGNQTFELQRGLLLDLKERDFFPFEYLVPNGKQLKNVLKDFI